MEQYLPEEQLIEYVKPSLKAKGFKKKNYPNGNILVLTIMITAPQAHIL